MTEHALPASRARAAIRALIHVVCTGAAWAAGWGLLGVAVALFLDPVGAVDDAWVATFGLPGFLCGALFAAGLQVRGVALGRAGLPGTGAWGAAVGLLAAMVPLFLAHPVHGAGNLLLLLLIPSLTALSALSALASATLLRILRGKRSVVARP